MSPQDRGLKLEYGANYRLHRPAYSSDDDPNLQLIDEMRNPAVKNYAPPQKIGTEEAETLAVAAFSAITGDEERMSRFMSISGLRPETIRQAAESSRFFAAILEYVVSDEPLLIALATELGVRPERLMAAHLALSPSEFE